MGAMSSDRELAHRHDADHDPRKRPADREAADAPPADLAGVVQAKADGGRVALTGDADVRSAAATGVQGGGDALPHLDKIQASFGAAHDLSGVRAHVGGEAATASAQMGAQGYATGSDVAFARQPDLFLAAHEAALLACAKRERGAVLKATVLVRWADDGSTGALRVGGSTARFGRCATAALRGQIPGVSGRASARAKLVIDRKRLGAAPRSDDGPAALRWTALGALATLPVATVWQLVSDDGETCVLLTRRDDSEPDVIYKAIPYTLLSFKVGHAGVVTEFSEPAQLSWESTHHNWLDVAEAWDSGVRYHLADRYGQDFVDAFDLGAIDEQSKSPLWGPITLHPYAP